MFNRYLSMKHNYQIYVDEVNFDCMEEYMGHMHKEKGYSPSSRNAFLAIAKLFFEYCIKCNLCSENPALQVGKMRLARNERIFLTEEEFEAFIECIGHPVSKLLAQTLYYTGLRISEYLKLRLQDVDLEERLIHVRFAKGSRYRAIPINDKLLVLLSD